MKRNRVRVVVYIDLDIGEETLDDDEWMQALIIDLKNGLAGHDWYIQEAVGLEPRGNSVHG